MRGPLERAEDRIAQGKVAAILQKKWNCVAIGLSRYYPVDYAFVRSPETTKIRAYAEVKCRNLLTTKYPTYQIGAYKLANMRDLAGLAKNEVPVLLVIKFTDRLGYVKITPDIFDICRPDFHVGGRWDRYEQGNDDIEPMARIPMEKFIYLEEEK